MTTLLGAHFVRPQEPDKNSHIFIRAKNTMILKYSIRQFLITIAILCFIAWAFYFYYSQFYRMDINGNNVTSNFGLSTPFLNNQEISINVKKSVMISIDGIRFEMPVEKIEVHDFSENLTSVSLYSILIGTNDEAVDIVKKIVCLHTLISLDSNEYNSYVGGLKNTCIINPLTKSRLVSISVQQIDVEKTVMYRIVYAIPISRVAN